MPSIIGMYKCPGVHPIYTRTSVITFFAILLLCMAAQPEDPVCGSALI